MTEHEPPASVFLRPGAGEIVSGDAAFVVPLDSGLFLAIVDVLGHGPEAALLAGEISEFLHARAGPDLVEIMGALHVRLRGTAGAAAALAWFDPGTGRLTYVGVGNTRFRRFGSADSRLISRDGTLGQHLPTLREQFLQLMPGDLALLTSDGVREHFSFEEYPGMLGDRPAVVARLVVQRFGKEYDDATCLALRYQP